MSAPEEAEDVPSLAQAVLGMVCARDSHEVLRHACVGAQQLAGADAAAALQMRCDALVETASLCTGSECERLLRWLGTDVASPAHVAWRTGRRQVSAELDRAGAPDTAPASWMVLVEPLRDEDVTHALLVLLWERTTGRRVPTTATLPPVLGAAAGVALSRVEELRRLRARAAADPPPGLLSGPAFRRTAAAVLTRSAWAGQPVSLLVACVEPAAGSAPTSTAAADLQVLATVERWRAVVRPYDLMVRDGGNGLVLLLPGTALPEAQLVARRLLLAHPRQVTAVLGSASTQGELGLDALVGAALHDRARRSRAR